MTMLETHSPRQTPLVRYAHWLEIGLVAIVGLLLAILVSRILSGLFELPPAIRLEDPALYLRFESEQAMVDWLEEVHGQGMLMPEEINREQELYRYFHSPGYRWHERMKTISPIIGIMVAAGLGILFYRFSRARQLREQVIAAIQRFWSAYG